MPVFVDDRIQKRKKNILMGPSKIIENFKKNCENSEMNSMYSGPRLIIFWCGPFLKSLLNLLQYCFCFMFWFFGHKACGILIPWPGIRPTNPAMEMQSLSPWTTREVPRVVIALSFFSLPFSYIHIYVLHLYAIFVYGILECFIFGFTIRKVCNEKWF